MKGNREILDRNIGLLLRHAYVPALPAPEFRQRLLHTLEIETRRLARERSSLDPSEPVTTLPRSPVFRFGTLLGAAAAVAILLLGFFLGTRGNETQLGRSELLARGEVAVQVGGAGWRAATGLELSLGIELDVLQLYVETPEVHTFVITTGAGRVSLSPGSALRAEVLPDEGARIERLLLTSGSASYAGPAGTLELELGKPLRLVDGQPEPSGMALADPRTSEGRRPVPTPVETDEVAPSGPALAKLTGDVRNSDGDPIESFRVGLLLKRVGNEYDDPDTRDFEGGVFEWKDIRPGEYRVYVRAVGYAVLDLGYIELQAAHHIEADLVRGGAVRGHVVDELTGNPIPDVLVLSEEDSPQDGLLLFPDADRYQWLPTSARTRADGSFELVNVNPGRHTLRANARGYGAAWTRDVIVTTDETTDGITLELGSSGAVEGLVTNADGSPRIDEQIIVAIWNENLAPRMNFASTSTDATGRYRVENLPEQQMLVIQVEKRFDARPIVKNVDIRGGETVVVDFIGGAPGTRVVGRVVDRDGRPIAHHNIALMDKNADWTELQENFNASTTSSLGEFEFEPVPPGVYMFYLVEEMGRWIRLVDQFEVPDWPEFERVIEVADLEVFGVVRDARNGEPVERCGMVLELVEGGTTLFAANTMSEADGTYTFGLLNPGRYRVTAYPTEDDLGFLKSHEFGIDEMVPFAEVDLELSDGAPVEVHVVDPDGAPVREAVVYFYDDGGEGYTLSQYPVTDAKGVFRAAGIRVGKLQAHVEARGYEPRQVTFECRPNTENRVEVTLTPQAGEER